MTRVLDMRFASALCVLAAVAGEIYASQGDQGGVSWRDNSIALLARLLAAPRLGGVPSRSGSGYPCPPPAPAFPVTPPNWTTWRKNEVPRIPHGLYDAVQENVQRFWDIQRSLNRGSWPLPPWVGAPRHGGSAPCPSPTPPTTVAAPGAPSTDATVTWPQTSPDVVSSREDLTPRIPGSTAPSPAEPDAATTAPQPQLPLAPTSATEESLVPMVDAADAVLVEPTIAVIVAEPNPLDAVGLDGALLQTEDSMGS